MQFIIIMVASTAVFAKIMVDAFSPNSTIRPLSDMDFGMYIGNFKFDLTSDENAWSCLVGASTLGMYRLCLDQMVVQRIMASPSVTQARRTVLSGALLLLLPYLTCTLLGIAITIWYRGCDPGLSGAIESIDQIIPHYISTELINVPGFVGLYLAGVVSAGTSTISSGINSQAAILYVDVISHAYKRADEHVLLITRCTAVILGVIMTAFSSLVIKMGSLTRGAGVSTLLMVVYQLWHMAGVISTGTRSPRLPVSTDYCPGNQSTFLSANVTLAAPNLQTEEPFFIFRLSYFWSSFFAYVGTIGLAVIISAVTGETKHKKEETLCNDALVRLWQNMRCLASNKEPHITKNSDEAKCISELEEASLMERDFVTRKYKSWTPDGQDTILAM
ncbi:hypothetical protein MTO96_037649 [Rhipicephalus appendiculatus]